MVSIVSIVLLLIISTISIDGAAVARNCAGSAGHHLQLNNFQLRPDPIKVPTSSTPNVVTFDLVTQITQDLVEPIRVDVVLEFQVLFFWVQAPCTNGAGSCSYPRLCDFCKTCACSYPTGTHGLTLQMNITSAIPTGNARATIQFYSATGQRGCVSVTGIVLN